MSGPITLTLPRRRLLGLSAAAVLAAAGCSGGGADGPLDVALWGNASRAELYLRALDLYLQRHPELTAELQFADLDPYLERLTTQAAAKELPDLMWMRDTHIGRYGSAGALLDLKEFLGSKINTDSVGAAGVSTGAVDDGNFALPTHYVGQALIRSVELFESAGVDVDAMATWAGFADVVTSFADPAASFYGTTDPTMGTTHRHLEAWIRQAGQEVFAAEGGIGFTAEVVGEWFNFWSRLRSAKVVPPPDQQVEADAAGDAGNLLVAEKCAVLTASTNHLSGMQALTKKKLSLSSIPVLPDSTEDWWFFPPILISGAVNTDNPEAVASMIDFFINDVDAAKITGLNQGAPSSATVRQALLPELDESETEFITQISREQENPSRPFPIRPEGSDQVNSAIARFGQEIAYGRMSVADGTAALIDEATKALA